MSDDRLAMLVVVALSAALVALWVASALRRWRGSVRAHARAARAGAGESAAVALLEGAGFTIVESQARVDWAPLVDGAPHHSELRADYLVSLGDRLFVAEVKTGDFAPSLSTAATRRQLLEYAIAFAADGVLLVIPERSAIHEIAFPALRLR